MADGTKIEWTDATWNPITGCAIVSPGCTNCYAMKLAGTRLRNHASREGLTRGTKAGPVWTGEVRFNAQWLDQPLRWTKSRMIFVCAHGDLFAEGVPDEWIDRVFHIMALSRQHTFQVLTKRPDRMRHYLTNPATKQLYPGLPLPNVWLGVSVEDQKRANERIPILLDIPAAIRWISAEPLLGPLDLMSLWFNRGSGVALERLSALDPMRSRGMAGWVGETMPEPTPMRKIDWVVAGGESGPGARPMHPDWARALRDQCAAAGVPFLFKQWGEWAADEIGREDIRSINHPPGHVEFIRVGKKAAGRKLEGIEHNGFPEMQR